MSRRRGRSYEFPRTRQPTFRKKLQRLRVILRYPRVRVTILVSLAILVAAIVWLPSMLVGVGAVLFGMSVGRRIDGAIVKHEAQAYSDGHAERLRKQREK